MPSVSCGEANLAQLRFCAFGGVSVANSGHPLGPAAGQPKRLALLAVLAESGTHGVSRDQLVALLWPESDTAHARNALNQAVHNLRRDLLADAVVEGGITLRFNPDVITSDLADFEAACIAGDLEKALELYRGPFLDGFHLKEAPEFERWAEDRRTEKRAVVVSAARQLAERAHAARELVLAERWTRRALAIDPYDELAVRRLLAILADGGDRAGGVRAFQDFARRLQQDLGVAPSAETRRLFERVSAGPEPPAENTMAALHRGDGVQGAQRSPDVVATGEAAEPIVARPRPWRDMLRRGIMVPVFVAVAVGGSFWRARARITAESSDPAVIVAIRPFENLGPDTGGTYLSAGMTDQVALYLSRIKGIEVASPSAVGELLRAGKSTREMADQLKATALISGSVSSSGDRLRIIAQVDDPRTGRRLWAESYDRTVTDAFSIQAAIALGISQTLGKRLTPEERKKVVKPRTTSVEADLLERRASDMLEPVPDIGRVEAAFRLLRQAVALDPQFARAYIDLAGAFMWSSTITGDQGLLDSIGAYTRHALDLGMDRNGQAEAYRLGALAYDGKFQYRNAITSNQLALDVEPGGFWATQGIGYDLLALGRPDSAYPWLLRSHAQSPCKYCAHLAMGWAFVALDSLAAAEVWIRETVSMFPEEGDAHVALARYLLLRGDPRGALLVLSTLMTPAPGRRYDGEPKNVLSAAIAASLQQGQYGKVQQLYRRLLREDPPPEDSLGRLWPDEWTCHRVGTDWAFARWAGRKDEGGHDVLKAIRTRDLAQIAKGAEEPCFHYEAGAITAALGNPEEAMRYLRSAAVAGWRIHRYARFDPMLATLRGTPDFEALLTEVADTVADMRRRLGETGS